MRGRHGAGAGGVFHCRCGVVRVHRAAGDGPRGTRREGEGVFPCEGAALRRHGQRLQGGGRRPLAERRGGQSTSMGSRGAFLSHRASSSPGACSSSMGSSPWRRGGGCPASGAATSSYAATAACFRFGFGFFGFGFGFVRVRVWGRELGGLVSSDRRGLQRPPGARFRALRRPAAQTCAD